MACHWAAGGNFEGKFVSFFFSFMKIEFRPSITIRLPSTPINSRLGFSENYSKKNLVSHPKYGGFVCSQCCRCDSSQLESIQFSIGISGSSQSLHHLVGRIAVTDRRNSQATQHHLLVDWVNASAAGALSLPPNGY